MEHELFSHNQRVYQDLVEQINSFLEISIGKSFVDYVLVAQTKEKTNDAVAKAIKIRYEELGWDVKIDTLCTDYHDCTYVSVIYFRSPEAK
jgi:hypothetical protein